MPEDHEIWTAGCMLLCSKKDAQLTISIGRANHFDPGSFCVFWIKIVFMCKVKYYKHPNKDTHVWKSCVKKFLAMCNGTLEILLTNEFFIGGLICSSSVAFSTHSHSYFSSWFWWAINSSNPFVLCCFDFRFMLCNLQQHKTKGKKVKGEMLTFWHHQ